MARNKARQRSLYIVADIAAAMLSWALFFVFRKRILEPEKFGIPIDIQFDTNFYLALIFIPIFWVSLYTISGMYYGIFRRYRLKEISQVTTITIIGVTLLFFIFILDDSIPNYKSYYRSYFTLLYLHFIPTLVFRFLITNNTVKRIHKRKLGFNTIYVGGSVVAVENYKEIDSIKNYPGYNFIGYVSANGSDDLLGEIGFKKLGKMDDLVSVIHQHNIEEVIIAVESSEHQKISKLLNSLQETEARIKVVPDMYDIMAGSVKMTSIFGSPLIEVNPQLMPSWQIVVKRAFDISASCLAILILIPIYITLMVLIKLSSSGPIFFTQERIGKFKAPFNIIKFRTMYVGSEKDGPQLSSSNDSRITPIGRFLRKTRLDETPQFFNVLKGDMSIVGPRPERQHYINLITEKAPHYVYLLKVKPGITSWGQVKYGYAENVDQMVQRLKFDLLYIENMSLALDIKIMFYTVLIILKGAGK
jgi:exopolysaccharide biosynthesis polyprenyl glycosylphosphotransferase